MKTENLALMRSARESLSGKWGVAIGTIVVYFLIVGALQIIPFIGPIAGLIIGGPLALGMSVFYMSISRNEEAELNQLFSGFNNFGNALGAYLLMALFTFLWTLLLIIPGIIAAISYAMTFFIMADDPSVGPMDAIDKSKAMMYGYKWKYFFMMLRFFLWSLLCMLTFGIGFLWLIPYMGVSFVKFYEDIKETPVVAEIAN